MSSIALTQLGRCLTAHLPDYRKNQVELLTLVVVALLQSKDVRHAELAERFAGSAQTSSVICQIERLFDRHPLCPADMARDVLTLIPSTRPREFILGRTFLGRTDAHGDACPQLEIRPARRQSPAACRYLAVRHDPIAV